MNTLMRFVRSFFRVRVLRTNPTPGYIMFRLDAVKLSTKAKSHTRRTPTWRYRGYDPRNSADRFEPSYRGNVSELNAFVKRARDKGAL